MLAAGVGQLVDGAAVAGLAAHEPFVGEQLERRIDRAGARPPRAAASLLELLHDLVAVARQLGEQQEDRRANVSPAHAPARPAAASSGTAERRPETMVVMVMSHAAILSDISL